MNIFIFVGYKSNNLELNYIVVVLIVFNIFVRVRIINLLLISIRKVNYVYILFFVGILKCCYNYICIIMLEYRLR